MQELCPLRPQQLFVKSCTKNFSVCLANHYTTTLRPISTFFPPTGQKHPNILQNLTDS